MNYKNVHLALIALADPTKTPALQRFFKTGKGEYGEGDKFLGIAVPAIRKLVKEYYSLSLSAIGRLVRSPYNEERLLGFLILSLQYSKGDAKTKESIYHCYLKNLRWVNNWNLVDLTAPNIIGNHLLNRERSRLYQLAKSKNLWARRIAIISTFQFIRQNQFDETLKITEQLFHDKQDLIHKACGWMLREVGKRDLKTLEEFLQQHYDIVPRTMLRYAIEHFPEKKRRAYLKGDF